MMIIPRREDAYHKMQLYRLLTAIVDHEELATRLCFKGGTCAAMLDRLDRFSVDLDFDLLAGEKKAITQMRSMFHSLFRHLDLEIKDESKTTLLFILRYNARSHERNTIQLDAVDESFISNKYQPQYLSEIDRYMNCHTIGTMFANKLVTLLDRFEKHGAVAGRDLYDIHFFFTRGHTYIPEIIAERRNTKPATYFQELIAFINTKLTQTVIDQDLNTLLPFETFRKIRGIIKQETLVFLQDELKRM